MVYVTLSLPIPTESCKPQKFTLTSITILTRSNCLFNQGRLYFPDSINYLSRLVHVLISIIFRNPQYRETDFLKLIQINSNIKYENDKTNIHIKNNFTIYYSRDMCSP